jgi:hypothetical protein
MEDEISMGVWEYGSMGVWEYGSMRVKSGQSNMGISEKFIETCESEKYL